MRIFTLVVLFLLLLLLLQLLVGWELLNQRFAPLSRIPLLPPTHHLLQQIPQLPV